MTRTTRNTLFCGIAIAVLVAAGVPLAHAQPSNEGLVAYWSFDGGQSDDCRPNGIPDECEMERDNWLTGWEYRRPVDITGSTSFLADYQVLVTVDTASLIGADKLRADCDDLRVTDADGTTLLNHWLESGCNTDSTLVWVKVPSVPTDGTTISMYYGNSSASSASNETNTFEFFDDFDDGNINGWTTSCESSCGSCLAYTTDTTYSISGSYSLYLYGQATCSSPPYCGRKPTVSKTLALTDGSYKLEFHERGWGGQHSYCSGGSAGLNYAYAGGTLIYNGGTRCSYSGCNKCSTSWEFASPTPFTVSGGSITIKLQTHASDCTVMKGWFDDIRVRKYVSPEPSASVGGEETHSDDCNSNGIPDESDIAAGTSLDINGNGIPDECEPPDVTSPQTSIVSGPADGEMVNVTEETFEWTGTDNFTPVGELVYSSCFWAECDPSSGPFGADTSYTFHGLDDGVVTIKVVSRDLAGNVDPTPVVRSFTVDLTPPEVVEQVPMGDVYVPVTYIYVTFSEAVNAETFTVDDIILTGPGGGIAGGSVREGSSSNTNGNATSGKARRNGG